MLLARGRLPTWTLAHQYARLCSGLFMKQVLPRFLRPPRTSGRPTPCDPSSTMLLGSLLRSQDDAGLNAKRERMMASLVSHCMGNFGRSAARCGSRINDLKRYVNFTLARKASILVQLLVALPNDSIRGSTA